MANRAPEKLAKILESLSGQRSKSYTGFNEKIKNGTYRRNRAELSKNLEYVNKEIPRLERKLTKKGESLAQKKGYEEKVKKLKALKTIMEEETDVEKSASAASNSSNSAKTAATAKTAASAKSAKSVKSTKTVRKSPSPATKKLTATQKLKMIKDLVC